MGILDKFKGLLQSQPKLDVDTRFERLRTSVAGTMADFRVARDRKLNKIVGLKICDPEKVTMFESRFKGLNKPSEGEIAVQMKHPNVVETFEYGVTTKDEPYLVMEYIEGPGLHQLVQTRAEKKLAGRRLSIIRQMAEAIRYVHSLEFIHRDVCPRNFIITSDLKTVKLIDFGLTVPATRPFMQPGNRTGTPLYMSPEIVRRRVTDQRVDIFAFGISAYVLCALEFPWPVADTTGRAALQHDTSPPKDLLAFRPELNPVFARAIMKCIQADLQQRTPSMEQFLSSIRGVESETA